MMFTKYIIVMDDVDVQNTSEVIFRLSANTDPHATASSLKTRPMFWTMQPAKSPAAASSASTRRRNTPAKVEKLSDS